MKKSSKRIKIDEYNISIDADRIESKKRYDINFVKSIYPDIHEIVYSKNFNNFLCDMKITKLSENDNLNQLQLLRFPNIYVVYLQYLCNVYGNGIKLLGTQYSNIEYREIPIRENIILNKPSFMEIPEDLTANDTMREIIETRMEQNLPYKYIYFPFTIRREFPYFHCNFSDQIFDKSNRFVCVQGIGLYEDFNHFIFLFIDNTLKTVEYYDPYIATNTKEQLEFISLALGDIFEDYKINKFWLLESIQSIEDIQDDEYGFCVIWGTIIFHLKLINMNMSILQIEKAFLNDCKKKKLSIYDVMLNYGHRMERIIPSEAESFKKLEMLFNG